MLSLLIRRELLGHLRSFRFAAASILCFAAVLGSIVLSALSYDAARTERNALVAQHHQEVLSYYAWTPLMWGGVRIDKPLNPMSLFTRDPDRGHLTVASVNAYWEPTFIDAGLQNPLSRLTTTVDLEFIAVAVLSLLAIVFSYDAVCGEREQGTLRLALSYSVSRGHFLIGKWIGGFLALAAPYLTALVCGSLVLSLGFDFGLDATAWAGLALLTMASLLYLLAIFGLGVCVSTFVRPSTTSIVLLLLIWSMAVIVVPSLAPYAAAHLSPVPSPGQIEKQKQANRRDIETRTLRARDRKPPSEFDAWLLWAAWSNGVRRDQFLEQMDMAENINERFRRDMTRQIDIAMHLSRISPAASFRLIAAGLSATGPRETDRFWQALVDYRRQICRFAYDSWAEMATNNHKRRLAGLGVQSTYHIDSYPRFDYRYVSLEERLEEALSDILLLCLWCALFLIAGYTLGSSEEN